MQKKKVSQFEKLGDGEKAELEDLFGRLDTDGSGRQRGQSALPTCAFPCICPRGGPPHRGHPKATWPWAGSHTYRCNATHPHTHAHIHASMYAQTIAHTPMFTGVVTIEDIKVAFAACNNGHPPRCALQVAAQLCAPSWEHASTCKHAYQGEGWGIMPASTP